MRSGILIPVLPMLLIMAANMDTRAQTSAYNLSKEIYQHARTADSAAQQKTLATLAWFLRADDVAQALGKLNDSTYPVLHRYANKLYDRFLKVEPLFSWNETQFTRTTSIPPDHKAPLWNRISLFQANRSNIEDLKNRIDRFKKDRTMPLVPADSLSFRTTSEAARMATIKARRDSLAPGDTMMKMQLDKVIDRLQASINELNGEWALADTLQKQERELARLEETGNRLKKEATEYLFRNEYRTFRQKDLSIRIDQLDTWTSAVSKDIKTIEEKVYLYEKTAAEQAAGVLPLSFKMPSQAEMIDALAIYLAKRVKQETVLWFFETIRRNAAVHGLIRESFPETMALLQGSEIYETPNLGAAWRYALSKDFITFPKHVFESQWLLSQVPPERVSLLQDLQTGFTISRLIQQQYNYTEIIRYLYLEQAANTPPTGSTPLSRHVINMLYATQQELRTWVNNPKDTIEHRLTYEDLFNMSDSSFAMMLELVNLRYDSCISGILGKTGTQPASANYAAIRTWFGKIQLTVRQIEKARQDLNKTVELLKNSPDKKDFSFSHYSVWKFLQELMNNVIPGNTLSPMAQKSREAFDLLSRTQEIYEQLETKNYSGAISITFKLLDDVIGKKADSAAWARNLYQAGSQTLSLLGIATDTSNGRLQLPRQWKNMYDAALTRVADTIRNGLYLALYGTPKPDYTAPRQDARFTFADGTTLVVHPTKAVTLRLPGTGRWQLSGALSFSFTGNTVSFKDLHALHRHLFNEIAEHSTWPDSLFRRFGGALQAGTFDIKQKDYQYARQVVTRIAGFLNDVALSTDSKQLARVVESYAMPPGSYKRKRNVWYSLDLNAFVGVYGGYEQPLPTFGQRVQTGQGGAVYGISAPIGITWSATKGKDAGKDDIKHPGNLKSRKKGFFKPSGKTFYATFSIIDPAAVVSYRFVNTDAVTPQEFKWDQIISPGLHAGWAIPGTPLVVNTGAVYTPQLRSITATQEGASPVLRQFNTIRAYAGVFFDLPLINLWEKKNLTRYKRYAPEELSLKNKLGL